jgi:hypothetical protein
MRVKKQAEESRQGLVELGLEEKKVGKQERMGSRIPCVEVLVEGCSMYVSLYWIGVSIFR